MALTSILNTNKHVCTHVHTQMDIKFLTGYGGSFLQAYHWEFEAEGS